MNRFWATCTMFCLASGLLASLSHAAEAEQGEAKEGYLHAKPEVIEAWRQLKFGLFVHWGPVSLKGTEIGWSRGGPRRGRTGTGSIPVEEYDNLYKRFDPVQFDAQQWTEIAKAAGMRCVAVPNEMTAGMDLSAADWILPSLAAVAEQLDRLVAI